MSSFLLPGISGFIPGLLGFRLVYSKKVQKGVVFSLNDFLSGKRFINLWVAIYSDFFFPGLCCPSFVDRNSSLNYKKF